MKNLLKRTKCDGIRPCPSVKHFYDVGNVIDYTHMPLTAAHLIHQGITLDDAEVITDMTGSQLNPLVPNGENNNEEDLPDDITASDQDDIDDMIKHCKLSPEPGLAKFMIDNRHIIC